MTAYTTNFHIGYLEVGQDMSSTRDVLEDVARTVDAALTRGGVAPPDTQAAVALIASTKPAVTVAPGASFAVFSVDRTPARAWVSAGTGRLVAFLKNTAALTAGTDYPLTAVLPTGYRPSNWTVTDLVLLNGTQVGRLDITTAGAVTINPGSAVPINSWVAVNAAWPM